MKEILFLTFSFLGICAVKAQSPVTSVADTAHSSSLKPVPDSTGRSKAFVKIYPNPVRNKAELEIHGFQPGAIQVQVLNVNGGVERNDQRLLISGNENLVLMFSLPAGVYFVVLRQKDKLVKKKMLVQ